MKTAKWETITPQIAQSLLDSSPGNRRLRTRHVNYLATQLSSGQWEPDSCEGIGIDVNGRLREGHHRMQAVVDSGVTAEFLVCRGLREKFVLAINRALSRTISDLISVTDPVGTTIATIHQLYRSVQDKPSGQDAMMIYKSPIGTIAEELAEIFPPKSKGIGQYFRAACVVRILMDARKEWIFAQARAIACRDYAAMTPRSHTFVRQIDSGAMPPRAQGLMPFARAFRTLDEKNSTSECVRVTATELTLICAAARDVIRQTLDGGAR